MDGHENVVSGGFVPVDSRLLRNMAGFASANGSSDFSSSITRAGYLRRKSVVGPAAQAAVAMGLIQMTMVTSVDLARTRTLNLIGPDAKRRA